MSPVYVIVGIYKNINNVFLKTLELWFSQGSSFPWFCRLRCCTLFLFVCHCSGRCHFNGWLRHRSPRHRRRAVPNWADKRRPGSEGVGAEIHVRSSGWSIFTSLSNIFRHRQERQNTQTPLERVPQHWCHQQCASTSARKKKSTAIISLKIMQTHPHARLFFFFQSFLSYFCL